MLRLAGGIMILAGCFGMGIRYKEQLFQRLKLLRQLAEILEMLTGEIRYGKSTLPECCKHVGERAQEPFGECMIRIYDEMQENTGDGFYAVLSRNMEECLSGLPLTKEDKEMFLHFASRSSFAEEAMQIRLLEQSREMMGHVISELEREIAPKSRMAVAIGAMSGMLLVIILL